MTNVWRLRIKSGVEGVNHIEARRFCFDNGLLGAGWSVEDSIRDGETDLGAYLAEAANWHGDGSYIRAATALGQTMQVGDFVWTVEPNTGDYWVARVTGPFVYRTGGDYSKFDLHMTRPCEWKRAGVADSVPGPIVRAFAGPFGTISQLSSARDEILAFSQVIFGQRATTKAALRDVACHEDLEDITGLYLQKKGWFVIPSSAKKTMPSYEFIVTNADGDRAGVQVKSGGYGYNSEISSDFNYFFIVVDVVPNQRDDSVMKYITFNDLDEFGRQYWACLPGRLKSRWRIT